MGPFPRVTLPISSRNLGTRSSRCSVEQNHFSFRAHDMLRAPFPFQKRRALLRVVTVPVINRRDPAFDVIKNLAHYQSRDSDSRHETGGRASQVVEAKVDYEFFFTRWSGFCRFAIGRPTRPPRKT